MKTRFLALVRSAWLLLTEVPGRPDASRRTRFWRALPLLVPATVLVFLLGWDLLVFRPEVRAVRAEHRPLLALETEAAAMRLSCSDDEAQLARTQAAEAAKLVAGGTDELNAQLRRWKAAAHDLGWDASFQTGDTTLEPPPEDASLTYLSARGRLAPTADNPEQFASLLRLLEQVAASPQRVDLTRLAVRADDAGRYALELNLRFAARVPHEKTP